MGGGLGVRDVTIPHPCAFGPLVTHGILCWRWEASTAQWVSDLQVKVNSPEVYRNKHGGGFCLGENEDANRRSSVTLLPLRWNDVASGQVGSCLGLFLLGWRWVAAPKGTLGVKNTFVEIKMWKLKNKLTSYFLVSSIALLPCHCSENFPRQLKALSPHFKTTLRPPFILFEFVFTARLQINKTWIKI